MKNLIFSLFAFVILFSSCSKDDGGILGGGDNTPACEKYKEGNMRVVNNLGDPYDISIDGVFKATINAHASKTFEGISADGHAFYAKQKSGYIFTPTEYAATVVITQCETQGVTLE